MAGKFRGLDFDVGWIKREFADIKRQLRELSSAKKLQAATIGRGGLTVADGGRVTGLYPSGRVAFEFGSLDEVAGGSATNYAYGFRVVKDEDFNGVTTNTLAEIFEQVGIGKVTRFSGADYFSATGESGVILSVTGGPTLLMTAAGMSLDGGSNGVRIEHTTTGSAANCHVGAVDGRVYRSTSSRRYKQDIEDTDVDPAAVLKMQPRTWRDKAEVEADPDTERRYVGFIAEELDELGLGQFVEYDDEGPEAIAYDRLSVALLTVLKDQDARLERLEKAAESKDKG